MRKTIALAFVALWSASASAAWKTDAQIDPMTDKRAASATVDADTGGATLRVGCINGTVFPEIIFPSVIGFGRVGVNHRFDDGPTVMRMARLNDDGREVLLWLNDSKAAADRIRQSKRLRLQVFPIGAQPQFFSFDLSGASDALAPISCR